ncbi:MAG TPA: M28 family peptidase [Bacteroidota bacterium]|nr:M28 family peptidase [Bacteroidota bacterium]
MRNKILKLRLRKSLDRLKMEVILQRHLRILLLCCFIVAGGIAQSTDIPDHLRTRAESITAARLAHDVEFLSSDLFRGRATPSPGLDSAAAVVVSRLKQAGVKPMGDKGGYLQYYTVHEHIADTASAFLEVGGKRFRFGEVFVINRFVPVNASAEVVYVGHGYFAPAFGVDAYKGVDVKGKFLLVHGPGIVPAGLRTGRLTGEVSPPIWEAARRGALGILYAGSPHMLEGWDRLRRSNLRRRELDPSVPSAYAAPASPAVVLHPQALQAVIEGESAKSFDLFPEAEERTYPASFVLKSKVTLHLPAASHQVHRPANVVAMIEGSDSKLRQEYITIAAHLDGAVGTEAVNGDSIYNAADDNATGTAALIAMAEAFQQGPRPRRSVIFLWDSGEEVGLWGTRWFVHNPPVPLDRIVAHFNIDMIGGTRVPGTNVKGEEGLTGPHEVYLVGPRVLSAVADSILIQTNRAYLNMSFNRFYDDPAKEFFYPRTDAGPFLERGILTIGYFTGLHPRYHEPSDEAEYLDPVKMETVARTAFVTAWMLADRPERVGIDKPLPSSVPRYR